MTAARKTADTKKHNTRYVPNTNIRPSTPYEELPERLTVTEARYWLDISRSHIAEMVADGRLPARPNPLDRRTKFVRREDLRALKEEGRAPTTRRELMPPVAAAS